MDGPTLMDVQIVVPMSGFGERFHRAGYTVPKPLIEIDGKPIIAHVVDLFPGEQDFLFICNQDHLDNPDYRMAEILREYCPTCRILGIPPHKLGPVHAVRQAEHMIDPGRPVLVNYCDFSCYWDWRYFKKFVAASQCAGAIPAYKGFHPHSLGTTNYAYMREAGGWVLDIQEKQPYTANRMEEYASSGSYYFASGRLMSDAFAAVMEAGLHVNGEYYVSLAYKPLLAESLPVAVYDLQHFMQWGTPEDVAEYNYWSSAFRRLAESDPVQPQSQGSLVIPMAGLGQRFSREGYTLTKPLIPVSGRPMVIAATSDLPQTQHRVFILREDMPELQTIITQLRSSYPDALIKTISSVTEGQACTALLGIDALEQALAEVSGPVIFAACDNGALYDYEAYNDLVEDTTVDVIVWGARGYVNAARNPHMFGWIDAENGKIRQISVKTPLGSPERDPIVTGTFTFRRAEDFRRSVERMIARDGRVNNEFYIDTCINDAIELGLTCRLYEVPSYLCWGTPNDLRTFEYWQSCFHKWAGHPYTLENDRKIPSAPCAVLNSRYQATIPRLPVSLPAETGDRTSLSKMPELGTSGSEEVVLFPGELQ